MQTDYVEDQGALQAVDYVEDTGDSVERAIVILGASNEAEGIAAEYEFLRRRFGEPGADWQMKRQSLISLGDKHYDQMEIEMADGSEKTIYFDVTSFFGVP